MFDIIHHEFRNILHIFFTYIYLCNTPSSIIVVKFMSSQYNSLPFCTFLSHPHHIFMHLASNGNHHHLHESHESWLICIEIENYKKFRFHFFSSIFFWLLSLTLDVSSWFWFPFAFVMLLLFLHLYYAQCAFQLTLVCAGLGFRGLCW